MLGTFLHKIKFWTNSANFVYFLKMWMPWQFIDNSNRIFEFSVSDNPTTGNTLENVSIFCMKLQSVQYLLICDKIWLFRQHNSDPWNCCRSHVAQSCYSVIGDKPFLWSKIQLSVTLYSLDRSLSTRCNWLRRRRRLLLICQFWLNFVGWGIPLEYVRYNLSVTFCDVPFFVHMPAAKKTWTDLHDRWLKIREIRQGYAFWGVRQNIFNLTSNIPQIPEILQKVFRAKHV